MAKEKSRYHTFLFYPDADGVPEDWQERFERLGVPIAISPLHCMDKAKGGGFKKPHYHGIYVANNPVTTESVRNKLRGILSTENVECKAIAKVQIIRESVENVYLYLTHESKDAIKKGKYIYDKKDIIHLNNFDIERYIVIDVDTKKEALRAIVGLVRGYKITNMPDLFELLEVEGEAYGLSDSLVEEVIKANTGYLRLWFDGNYQKYHRPR